MTFMVFIGFDKREKLAWEVCAASMQAHTGEPVTIAPISRSGLIAMGDYHRPQHEYEGIEYDDLSRAPVSTDFAIARFWVPYLAPRGGWALYCDCDFLWRTDVRELFALADPRYAVMVVKHEHKPAETEKMDGQVQTTYPRKNWSSLVLWNLAHAGGTRLTRHVLNSLPGRDLHAFCWLDEAAIGELPECWNWLDGHSSEDINPSAVHFTRGTPDMRGFERTRYADEWMRYASALRERRR